MPGLSLYGRYTPGRDDAVPPSQAVTPCGGSSVPLFREFARLYTDDEVLEGGLDFGKVQGDSG
jgi:hypothetical protein